MIIEDAKNIVFKLNVYIGKSFSYSNPESRCAISIPINSIYIPCHPGVKEFELISACVTVVADYYDFYQKDLNKNRYIDFKVTIYLNRKSLHKTFGGADALKYLEKLEKTKFDDINTFEL